MTYDQDHVSPASPLDILEGEVVPANSCSAAKLFRDAEERLDRSHRVMLEHLDRRMAGQFDQALPTGDLSATEQAELGALRAALKSDFSARQRFLHQRLTLAMQSLALSSIDSVSRALALGAEAASDPLPLRRDVDAGI
ncbi:MAG: hypothetical protein HZB71_11275 [Betaproteobacteria bacterium]|nr:hypothetical protein [Betaproteobacteria bacterium]